MPRRSPASKPASKPASQKRVHTSRRAIAPGYLASLTPHDDTIALCDMTPEDSQPICLTSVPGSLQTSRFLGTIALYHRLYAERLTDEAATIRETIAQNNADVASIANGLSLDVKVYQSEQARVLQFDALAMAKRIEAAGAKHKNKGPRNHKGANRHLAYRCPACSRQNPKTGAWSNTIRASASDRLIMCAGRHGAVHEPTLCEFDESSQPDYRLADASADTAANPDTAVYIPEAAPVGAHGGTRGAHSRSGAALAANKQRYANALHGIGASAEPAHSDRIGFADDKSEFGF